MAPLALRWPRLLFVHGRLEHDLEAPPPAPGPSDAQLAPAADASEPQPPERKEDRTDSALQTSGSSKGGSGRRSILNLLRGRRADSADEEGDDEGRRQVVEEQRDLWRRRHFLGTHGGRPCRRLPHRRSDDDDRFKDVFKTSGGQQRCERALAPLPSTAIAQRRRPRHAARDLPPRPVADTAALEQALRTGAKPAWVSEEVHKASERSYSRQTVSTRSPDAERISFRTGRMPSPVDYSPLPSKEAPCCMGSRSLQQRAAECAA